MAQDQVRFRLIRADDAPATNPEGDAFIFGLQDSKHRIDIGVRDASGRFVFYFILRVKPSKDGVWAIRPVQATSRRADVKIEL